MRYATLLDDGIETVDFVGCVGYFADGAIWLLERVAAVHDTVDQCLLLVLIVAGVCIADAVAETVLRIRVDWFSDHVFHMDWSMQDGSVQNGCGVQEWAGMYGTIAQTVR